MTLGAGSIWRRQRRGQSSLSITAAITRSTPKALRLRAACLSQLQSRVQRRRRCVSEQPVYHSCNDGFNAEGVASQSPGLNAAFCVQPWVWDRVELYPERVEFSQSLEHCDRGPRVGRKKRGQPWALRRGPFRAVILLRIFGMRDSTIDAK